MALKRFTIYNASFISREFKFSRQLTQIASWIAKLPLAISPQRVHHVAQATTRRASPSSALPFPRNGLIILSTSRKLFVKQNFGIVPKSAFSLFEGQCPDAGLRRLRPDQNTFFLGVLGHRVEKVKFGNAVNAVH